MGTSSQSTNISIIVENPKPGKWNRGPYTIPVMCCHLIINWHNLLTIVRLFERFWCLMAWPWADPNDMSLFCNMLIHPALCSLNSPKHKTDNLLLVRLKSLRPLIKKHVMYNMMTQRPKSAKIEGDRHGHVFYATRNFFQKNSDPWHYDSAMLRKRRGHKKWFTIKQFVTFSKNV